MGFDHPDPEPVVIEEAPDTEPIADAAVEIARIEADKEVTITKIQHRAIDDELAVELAALRAENESMRAQLAPPDPEPVEIPVEVADPAPEPDAEPDSAPPAVESTSTTEPKSAKRKNPWF
jgi:hypothetical protein